MLKTERVKSLVVLIAAGFIGGAMSRVVTDMIPRANAQREKAEQVLKAGRFELVDSQGRTRAALFIENERRPSSMPMKTASLTFYDEKGASLIDLGTETRVAPVSRLWLKSPQGDRTVSLSASPANATLEATKNGKVVWSAP